MIRTGHFLNERACGLTALFLCLSLIGCGGGGSSEKRNENAPPSNSVNPPVSNVANPPVSTNPPANTVAEPLPIQESKEVNYREIIFQAAKSSAHEISFRQLIYRTDGCRYVDAGKSEPIPAVSVRFAFDSSRLLIEPFGKSIEEFDLSKDALAHFAIGYKINPPSAVRTSHLIIKKEVADSKKSELYFFVDFLDSTVLFSSPAKDMSFRCGAGSGTYNGKSIYFSIPDLAYKNIIDKKINTNCTDENRKNFFGEKVVYQEIVEIKSGNLLIGGQKFALNSTEYNSESYFKMDKGSDGKMQFNYNYFDGYAYGLVIKGTYDSFGNAQSFSYSQDTVKCTMS